MIRKFLLPLLLAACPFITPHLQAQKLDLIVTKKGDSIACHIDSITGSAVYFEMKNDGQWIHTNIGHEKISDYQQDTINRKDYLYKPGTTTIESANSYELQRNTIYLGIGTLTYGRTFGSPPVSYTAGVGLAAPDGLGCWVEATMLFGRAKHFFETGLSTAFVFNDFGKPLGIILRIGYRYQGPRGFLFRSGPTLGIIDGDVLPLPAMSVGYAF